MAYKQLKEAAKIRGVSSTDDSGGKWPLPLMTYAECCSLRLSLALASFFFPAWFTFENINLCPRKFLARKINPPTYNGAMPTPPPPIRFS